MSAIRNNLNRSEARKQRSTPYARGFISTISRFITYFTGSPTEHAAEADDEEYNGRTNASQPNPRQIVPPSPKYNFSSGNRAPLTPSNAYNGSRSALPGPSTQPVPNAEQVASYFSQRMGTNVSTNEVESIITNLQTSPERERFRFTFTTPGRTPSPAFAPSNINSCASPNISPSKKLARNPNGVYRWEGGGSAKAARQRNRFASPAFAASPVKTGRPVTEESGEDSRLPVQDNKRRKVGDRTSATTSNGVPFPNMPSTPRTNGVLPQTPSSPSSRLRTPAKLTAPVNPSPLRQAWSDASSTSSHEDSKPSPPAKPTKAANLVAELIKETAPRNKPDLSNPYQIASPVSKVGPPRRATKRPRAVGKPPIPTKEQKAEEEKRKAEEQKKEEEEKLKALSAQAIIEATLPKGSKRSRPPAKLEKLENKPTGDAPRSRSPTSHTPSIPMETITYTVEDAEDSERPKKKSRSSSGERSQPKAILADVTIEEIEDVDMDKEKSKEQMKLANSASQVSRTAQTSTFKPTSIPREPSKLRFSFQAESSSGSPTPLSTPAPLPSSEDQAPPSISTTLPGPPSIQAVSNGFNFSFRTPPPKEQEAEPIAPETAKPPEVDAIKVQVLVMNIEALPTFTLSPTGATAFSGTAEHIDAREVAIHHSSLPAFAFPTTKPFSFGFDLANRKPAAPFPIKESSPFDPIPGMKASTTPSSNIFGPIPSKSSTLAIATPVPTSTSVTFDFAAAGMKPPSFTKDTWKCSQCGLSNPQDAAKCTICDEPKSSSTWATAGLKPPTASNDTWKCDLCGLSSPKSATKCTICDADAPGNAPSISGAASVPAVTKHAVSSTNMFEVLASKPVT